MKCILAESLEQYSSVFNNIVLYTKNIYWIWVLQFDVVNILVNNTIAMHPKWKILLTFFLSIISGYQRYEFILIVNPISCAGVFLANVMFFCSSICNPLYWMCTRNATSSTIQINKSTCKKQREFGKSD